MKYINNGKLRRVIRTINKNVFDSHEIQILSQLLYPESFNDQLNVYQNSKNPEMTFSSIFSKSIKNLCGIATTKKVKSLNIKNYKSLNQEFQIIDCI